MKRILDADTVKKAELAGERITDFERYFNYYKTIPWEEFETPVGKIFWSRVKSTGKIRLFLEGHEETPAVALRTELRIAIANILRFPGEDLIDEMIKRSQK